MDNTLAQPQQVVRPQFHKTPNSQPRQQAPTSTSITHKPPKIHPKVKPTSPPPNNPCETDLKTMASHLQNSKNCSYTRLLLDYSPLQLQITIGKMEENGTEIYSTYLCTDGDCHLCEVDWLTPVNNWGKHLGFHSGSSSKS
nr:hypothetical protein Iba_chr09fCG12730 [Ipomoea batatas]